MSYNTLPLKYRPQTDLFYCNECHQSMHWETLGTGLILRCDHCHHAVMTELVDIEAARISRLAYLSAQKSASKHHRAVKLQHPEKFVGKRVPRNYDWDGYMVGDYALCDDCRRLFHCDDMHSLLYPLCPADWELQRKLHIEEPMSFCLDCLTRLEREADVIDPEWRVRQGLSSPIEAKPDMAQAACAITSEHGAPIDKLTATDPRNTISGYLEAKRSQVTTPESDEE